MAKTLEDIFVSEFRKAVSNVGYKDIYKIPLPKECNDWYVSGTDLYGVKGIGKEYYCSLNKSIVKKVPNDYQIKRRLIDKSTRGFSVDSEGKYIYSDFSIPIGSIAVMSNININLPYSEYKKSSTKDGYGYVDFVTNKGVREFMYVLPKSVLYKVNQTALALSVKNMKNYSGNGYVTWNNGVIYLHVIPYNPRAKYEGTKILKTGYSLNYCNEINKILSFWQEYGIIPNIEVCSLSNGSNLVVKETTVGYDEFIPVDNLALSDKEIYGSSEENII